MKSFTAKTFTIPALKGISAKTIEEHLKLYNGYVNNANAIVEKMHEYKKDRETHAYALSELRRRLSFEYNGIRNHEVYFSALEGGPKAFNYDGSLKKAIEEDCGPIEEFLMGFKAMAASTRGIGWAALWYDPRDNRLLASWIDEQHIGELNGCTMILGIDMWEHSYVADYQPSGKKQYVEDFFANLNWEVIENNFAQASK